MTGNTHYGRRAYLKSATAVTVGLTALSGCSGILGGVPQDPQIEITGDGFAPKNTHVDPNQPVSWVNKDDEMHGVVNASDNWQMEVTELEPGEVTGHKFQYAGVYEVVCPHHGDPENFTGERMKVAVGDRQIDDPVG